MGKRVKGTEISYKDVMNGTLGWYEKAEAMRSSIMPTFSGTKTKPGSMTTRKVNLDVLRRGKTGRVTLYAAR